MSIETRRGIATGIIETGKRGVVECQIGETKITLHPDLVHRLKEGDDILVAGDLSEDGLHALALKNITQNKTVKIDGSNQVFIIGIGLFFWTLGFIFAMQILPSGNTTLVIINSGMSVAGCIVCIMAISRLLRIKRAERRTIYGAEEQR